MRVVKLTLAYDGTGFVGWQRQAGGASIQAIVERAIEPFASRDGLALAGAGRTDAGVHAIGQAVSARVDDRMSPADLQRALNARLPPAIRVTGAEEASATFHARYAASAKTYAYHIVQGPFVMPFEVRYAWHVPRALDLAPMREACAALAGTHDFAAFRAAGSRVRDTRRTIFEARLDVDRDGTHVTFTCRGDGFLRHMVRSLVGTLVDVGHGRFPAGHLAALLAAPDRGAVGATAPPHGLFLVSVDY
jgi:tRNA pseudouridine38-40 synthase